MTICGCAYSGRMDITELAFRRISPKGPLIDSLRLSDCLWWSDEGAVYIGMSTSDSVIPLPAAEKLDFSFVLPGFPADRSREYQVNNQTLRGYVRKGLEHERYRSTRGIVAIWLEPGDSMRIRFRLIANKEIFHVLTGWVSAGQVVLTGSCRARRDSRNGPALLSLTERDGMTRSGAGDRDSRGRPKPRRVKGPAVKG